MPPFILLLCLSLLGFSVSQQQPATKAAPVTAVPTAPGLGPVCDPDNFDSSDPPVPDLPDQFSCTVEWTRTDNVTAIITEYFDGPHNRGRIEGGFNGTFIYYILDYSLGEIFFISDVQSEGDCRVYDMSDNPSILNFSFGIENRNGTFHSASPRTFLEKLRSDTPTRYVGEEMVRGILTQHWQACFHGENGTGSYSIDYYFVDKSWTYGRTVHNPAQTIPVQFTFTQLLDGENNVDIYSFVDFQYGPDSVPDSVFRVPNGLACPGRFPGQPVPQVPQYFSTYVQVTSNLLPSTHYVQTYRVRHAISL